MASTTSSDPTLTNLEMAVIALEDRRFLQHQGYDWRSIVREIAKAMTFQKYGGASTIDIQLFRTISNRYERTMRRKIREAVGARALQSKCSKLSLLRAYLDKAYFGTELIGQEAASTSIFGKGSSDLDTDEATYIAALLVYPKPRVATANWSAKVRRRAEYGRFLLRTSQKHLKKVNC